MSRVVHFEIPANDTARAKKFYSDVFGWEFTSYPGPTEYLLIKTGEDSEAGINGGMMARQMPGQTLSFTIDVADLDASVAKAQQNGASLAVPRMPIPGVGWLAYIIDPEQNLIGMMQPDTNAK